METREDLSAAVRGYWPARALLAAAELGVFRALGRRRLTAETLARRLGARGRGLPLLLDALAGQGVLVKRARSYSIAPAMLPFLTEGPDSALGMLDHHANLWRLWDRLPEVVLTGAPPPGEPGFRGGPEAARVFTRAMRDGAIRFAAEVAVEVDLSGRRRLADLGGGPGIYAVAFARRHPDLEVVVMDLPDVVAVGEEIVARERDVAGRVTFLAGDIDRDPLPEGIDSVFLSNVIHGKGEKGVRRLFDRILRALPPGGLFVIRDFFLDDDGVTPAPASLFSLNMLVATPNGRCHRLSDVTRWLQKSAARSDRQIGHLRTHGLHVSLNVLSGGQTAL